MVQSIGGSLEGRPIWAVRIGDGPTPMLINEFAEQYFGEHPRSLSAFENLLPVQLIDASDVSEAMVYLCGHSGRYITGITLPVDGGLASTYL